MSAANTLPGITADSIFEIVEESGRQVAKLKNNVDELRLTGATDLNSGKGIRYSESADQVNVGRDDADELVDKTYVEAVTEIGVVSDQVIVQCNRPLGLPGKWAGIGQLVNGQADITPVGYTADGTERVICTRKHPGGSSITGERLNHFIVEIYGGQILVGAYYNAIDLGTGLATSGANIDTGDNGQFYFLIFRDAEA